jgi:hypothetical protein
MKAETALLGQPGKLSASVARYYGVSGNAATGGGNEGKYTLKWGCDMDKKLMPKHINPACERWELHRVWVVEATRKDGVRHAQKKRRYYIDEDTFGAAVYDAWDDSGASVAFHRQTGWASCRRLGPARPGLLNHRRRPEWCQRHCPRQSPRTA